MKKTWQKTRTTKVQRFRIAAEDNKGMKKTWQKIRTSKVQRVYERAVQMLDGR